jgi:hypothetical protein
MAGNRPKLHRTLALALFVLAEATLAVTGSFLLTRPVHAQVVDERFPFLEDRARRQRQNRMQELQQWNQQNSYGPDQRAQDSARAPAPRRPETPPSVNVMVFGDSMAEWLAYGLEEAFADTPEVGITRKPRTNTGLIRVETRGEAYDWPQGARDILNAEKPDYIVIMLGPSDRRGIREAIKAPPRATPGQKQDQKQAAQPPQGAQPAATPTDRKPNDTEAPPASSTPGPSQDQEQPTVMTPESGPTVGTVVREFRSEEWGELYSRRVDEMIGVLKARGVPVFWVGLPSVRGSRATSETVYLNDIYRGRAEKAGINYIDVWDGFVDDAGTYNNYGPDFEGQIRRLRAGDGANFTRAGARKLAHYVERELRRVMQAKLSPAVATPEPEPEAKEAPAPAAPGLPPRPIASPVMSLTAPRGAGDALLGGAPVRNTSADSVATRVLVKGEAIEAPAGRADDFAWPRRDIVTATGVLPPDPVEPPPKADAAVASTPAATTAPTQPKQAAAPRQPREQPRQQHTGWQPWWAQQRQEPPRSQGFFGGWFGGRW